MVLSFDMRRYGSDVESDTEFDALVLQNLQREGREGWQADIPIDFRSLLRSNRVTMEWAKGFFDSILEFVGMTDGKLHVTGAKIRLKRRLSQ